MFRTYALKAASPELRGASGIHQPAGEGRGYFIVTLAEVVRRFETCCNDNFSRRELREEYEQNRLPGERWAAYWLRAIMEAEGGRFFTLQPPADGVDLGALPPQSLIRE